MSEEPSSYFEIVEPTTSSTPAVTVEHQRGLKPIYRASNVDRWVPHFVSLVDSHRKFGTANIKVNFSEMRLQFSTADSRISAAARSLIEGWTSSPLINRREFSEIRPHYTFVIDPLNPTCLQIRPKHGVESQPPSSTMDIVEITMRVTHSTFEKDIKAVATLFMDNVLRGYVRIEGMLDDELKFTLERQYNRLVEQKEPNLYLML